MTQAAVLAREDSPSGKRLVAYVVAVPGAKVDSKTLRRNLAMRLPDYMVPSAFVVLEKLPLTSSGKLDRSALPRPDLHREIFRARRTREEQVLCDLFAVALSLERVGIDDDFFELGAHSLLIVRLANAIARTRDQDVPLSLFFRHRTVEQMAAILEQRARAAPAAPGPLAASCAGDSRTPFFCLSEAPVLASQLDDWPVHSLGCYYDDLRECSSIEEIAAVNTERIRTRQKEGPYQLSGFCGMALVAFEVARRLKQQGQEVSLLALIDPPSLDSIPHHTRSPARRYAGRVRYHLSRLARVHPRFWLGYCIPKSFTIRRRIFAWSMQILKRTDKVDVLSRMEKAIMTYTPEIYPGRVTLFVATRRVEKSAGETDFGWGTVSGGGLDIRVVPGDHSTIFDDVNIRCLASELRDLLV